MTKEESNFEVEILKMVEKLEREIPTNRELSKPATMLDTKIVALFAGYKKPLAPKEVFQTLGEKSQKWYSDRLWALKNKGLLISPAYGFYQIAPKA